MGLKKKLNKVVQIVGLAVIFRQLVKQFRKVQGKHEKKD
jgi:hypothetical protein